MWQNYNNGFDKTIPLDMTKLYNWMWQNYSNGFDETIQRDMTNYTNGCDKTTNECDKTLQINLTALNKWQLKKTIQMNMTKL